MTPLGNPQFPQERLNNSQLPDDKDGGRGCADFSGYDIPHTVDDFFSHNMPWSRRF